MEPTREELLARIKELEKERDMYKGHLAVLLRNENLTFTQEEIDDLDKNGIPFEDIVKEVTETIRRAEAAGQQGHAA
jgi:hypothetical protein